MKTLAQKPALAGPVWALTGPTGTGKSALACALALEVGAEVISCDSVQVYRGLDCASAKPTPAQREAVCHHLVDVRAPNEPLDAHGWCTAARAAIADVRGRGRVPLLVGGTGLYLRALARGLIEVPSDAALRAQLYAELAEGPAAPAALHARLRAIDPVGAERVHPNNPAHLVRALEISLLTGRPASAVRAEHAAEGPGPDAVPLAVVALDGPNLWLRARLEARSAAMVAAGLLEEVRGLQARGIAADTPAMRAVGYRQAVAVLTGALDREELPGAIFAATWAYVRRQRTWLRREPPHAVLPAEQADAPGGLSALLASARGHLLRAAAAAPAGS